MSRTFDCPTCGAPLEPEGSQTTVRCPYCAASVVVPEDLREPEPLPGFIASISVGGVQAVIQSGPDFTSAQMEEITGLIRGKNKIEAIKRYREVTGQGLKESKEAVEEIERLLEESGAREPDEVAAVFARAAAQETTFIPTPPVQPPARPNRGLLALIGIVVAAGLLSGIIIPILAATAVTRSVSAVSEPVSVAETARAVLRTPSGPQQTATPAPTFTPSPTPGYADLVLSFGSEGIGPGQFLDARSVATGPDGRIYVAEYTGGRVQVLDSDGKFLRQIRVNEELPLQGLAVDREGLIYISQGGKILQYSAASGELSGEISPPRGQYFGHFALTLDGRIAAVASSAERLDDIVVMDTAGNALLTIQQAFTSRTKSPELDMTLAVDGSGNIYALGSFNIAVLKFGPDGEYLFRFGRRGDGPGQFRSVQGIAADGQGRVFVSDSDGVKVYDQDGQYLDLIHRQPTVNFGLAVSDQDELFVAARTKVYKFTMK